MPTYGQRKTANVLDYASGFMWLTETDGSVTGSATAGMTWVDMGWTQGTKISKEVEEFSEIDDSGKVVVKRSTDKSCTIEGVFLERSANIRNLSTSGGEQYYALTILGAKLQSGTNTTVYEVWVFPKVTFDRAFEYEIGGKARMGYKLTAFDLSNAVTYPLPSGSGWSPTTTTITIPTDSFYTTQDIT